MSEWEEEKQEILRDAINAENIPDLLAILIEVPIDYLYEVISDLYDLSEEAKWE